MWMSWRAILSGFFRRFPHYYIRPIHYLQGRYRRVRLKGGQAVRFLDVRGDAALKHASDGRSSGAGRQGPSSLSTAFESTNRAHSRGTKRLTDRSRGDVGIFYFSCAIVNIWDMLI